MPERIVIGIADLGVAAPSESLVTYALGSCVGICLRDPLTGISGLAHILLPDSKACPHDTNRAKFADTAIEELLLRMKLQGAARWGTNAKIAGGASLFAGSLFIDIGERNIRAVKTELARCSIPILAEDTGSGHGRTIEFFAQDGSLHVRSVRCEKLVL